MSYIEVNVTKNITDFTETDGYYVNSTDYYGALNTDVLTNSSASGINGVNFQNDGIILGGGGGVYNPPSTQTQNLGVVGCNGLTNSGTINTLYNNGAFLGGGGSGGGGAFGGAGGGGGGGGDYIDTGGVVTWIGVGGSLVTTLNGESSTQGAGGGGPGGNGGNNLSNLYIGGSNYDFFGGGGASDSPSGIGINATEYSGGNGNNALDGGFVGGGGGYGGGDGGISDFGGGGGGGGGLGGVATGATGGSSYFGGNGGYGIVNTGTITNLYNSQGGENPYLYGPLFYSGNAPTNYYIKINSTSNYGQLWNLEKITDESITGTINFNIAPGSTLSETTYSSVLTGVTVSLSSKIGTYNDIYQWELVENSDNTSFYDLIITKANLSLGEVTTIPSPLIQNNAGTLIYYNETLNPILYHSYILKNVFGNNVSNILMITNINTTEFRFTNVIIPYGGINTLYIYDLTTKKIIVNNIEITVSNVCFKEGTKILCYINKKEIYVPIEKICEGDFVKIYDGKNKNKYKKAKIIIKSQIMNSEKTTINKLYKLSKSKNHNLIDDLYVTGSHAILHDSLSEDELEKMEALANHYNSYNIIVENDNLTEKEKEDYGLLLKYYHDYKITLFDKYKLIAYYDLDFEEVKDEQLYNIYHLVIENENKYGSYGVYANGILAETTDEAGLIRFPNYEKINTKIKIEKPIEKETILDKIAKKINKRIIVETDKHIKKNEEIKRTEKVKTYKKNKIIHKNVTLRKY